MSINRINVVKSRFFSVATTARSMGSIIDTPFESHLQAATTQHRRRGKSPIVADVEPESPHRAVATPSEIHGLSSTEKLRMERPRPRFASNNDVVMSATDKHRMARAQKSTNDTANAHEVKPAPVQDADGHSSPLAWFSTFFKK
mmetsp:Transcript_9784/g.15510  ORF Transcript_9784/g.15510 Transcript_9784/m.15510 type:complete len:144 (-) Transcript_9784:262-693(-)